VKRRDWIIVGLIGLILLVLFYPQIQEAIVAPPPPEVEVVPPYSGPIKFTIYTRNSFKTASQLSLTCEWYRKTETGWFNIGSGNMTITLMPADEGVIYLRVYSSSNYVDDNLILGANSYYIKAVEYEDANGDGYLDHMFRLFLTEENVKAPQGVTPEISLIMYGMPLDGTAAFNSPSNILSIGTSPVDKYVNWKIVFSGDNKAIKAIELYIATNASDTTEINVVQVASVFGTFGADRITWEAVNKRWYIYLEEGRILSKEPEGKLLAYKSGMNPDFAYFTVKIHCTFASTGTAYYVTITMRIIKPDNSIRTITDKVELKS